MEVFDVAANIEDKLIERVRSLAPDKQRAVLDFVEDLAEPESKNLWDKIREIMESVPPEAWERYTRRWLNQRRPLFIRCSKERRVKAVFVDTCHFIATLS